MGLELERIWPEVGAWHGVVQGVGILEGLRDVAWHSPRGGVPGPWEQQLCRPMGQGLLLDHGVKPSSI
jgi:hypothetical protein